MKIKQNDTLPALEFTVFRTRNRPLPFIESEVVKVWVVVTEHGGDVVLEEEASDWSMTQYELTGNYEWEAGDTDDPGQYGVEVVVDLSDNRRITFPNHYTGQLEITRRFGPVPS